MTANWASLDAALQRVKPNHFTEPEWLLQKRSAVDAEGKEVIVEGWELLAAEMEEKGLPYRLGKPPRMVPIQPLEEVW
jgi:hypothetical protein